MHNDSLLKDNDKIFALKEFKFIWSWSILQTYGWMDGYYHIQTKSIFIRRKGQDFKKIKGKIFEVILISLLVYG